MYRGAEIFEIDVRKGIWKVKWWKRINSAIKDKVEENIPVNIVENLNIWICVDKKKKEEKN